MEIGRGNERQELLYCRRRNRGSLILAWDGTSDGKELMLANSFVSKEKERFVLLDRAAKVCTEFVALERGLQGRHSIKEVSRVQIIVAEKLEQLAVVCIGSGTSREVYDGARVPSVLCWKC